MKTQTQTAIKERIFVRVEDDWVLICTKKEKKVFNHNPPFCRSSRMKLIVEYTVLFPVFERCTCKWINVVQLLSGFDGSSADVSQSRGYLLRCVDTTLRLDVSTLLLPPFLELPILEACWRWQSLRV